MAWKKQREAVLQLGPEENTVNRGGEDLGAENLLLCFLSEA